MDEDTMMTPDADASGDELTADESTELEMNDEEEVVEESTGMDEGMEEESTE